MNGPNSMYKIRPVIKLAEEIELPKCMYRMKIIQNSFCNARVENLSKNTRATSLSEQSPLPEVAALESRQEAILEQLAQLKRLMSTLRAELKQQTPPSATQMTTHSSVITNTHLQAEVPQDIVINANPHHPPYSLLALRQLWQNCLTVKSHIHSTVTDLPQHLVQFAERFSAERAAQSPLLNVRLIWKNVSDTELVVAPTRHSAVRGEVNVLRYLSRIGPSEYNYELSSDPASSSGIDSLLDLCYSLATDRTVKDRQAHVRALNAHLKKTQFLTGDGDIALPDIAAWSTLKQIGYTTTKDLTVNMNKWFQRCDEKFALVS